MAIKKTKKWVGTAIKVSSRRYLDRQDKDPYVAEARKRGYRSRAVFKLMEVDEKFNFLKPGITVVDLGAAPGSWSQVAVQRILPGGHVYALDRLFVEPMEGMTFLKGDFTEDDVYEAFLALCPEGVDVVLSDMAPDTSGHAGQDHLRIMMLAELAHDFALKVLKKGGLFYCKLFQGGEETAFRDRLRADFEDVRFYKPASSRKDSREIFIFAQGFKGREE